MFYKEPLNPLVTIATITRTQGKDLFLKVRKYNPTQFEVYERVYKDDFYSGKDVYERVPLKNSEEGVLNVIERMWPNSKVEFIVDD